MTIKKRIEVYGDWGAPKSREEFRLFDRWTLWVRYSWFHEGEPRESDGEKEFRERMAAANEAMAKAIGGKLEHKVGVPEVGP